MLSSTELEMLLILGMTAVHCVDTSSTPPVRRARWKSLPTRPSEIATVGQLFVSVIGKPKLTVAISSHLASHRLFVSCTHTIDGFGEYTKRRNGTRAGVMPVVKAMPVMANRSSEGNAAPTPSSSLIKYLGQVGETPDGRFPTCLGVNLARLHHGSTISYPH